MRNKKLLFTGGHAASTAYAVIEQIKSQNKNWDLYFIGGRTSLEGKKTKPLQQVTFENSNVKNYNIISGRLQRKLTIWTIPSILKIPIGFLQAFFLLIKIRPNVVVSFGGYASFPVVVISWLFRIKIIIHEQTAAAGRSNLAAAKFANSIAISRKQSIKYFPKKKTVLTGNPISPKLLTIKPKRRISKQPIIFITGGASGSVTINNTLDKILEKLLKKYKVVHQTGDFQFKQFKTRKQSLPERLTNNYGVKGVIPSQKWPDYLSKADIIISRSGANIVAEIVQIKRPAILIPLPIAYLNEQLLNAQIAKEIGLAEIIEQKELTPEILLRKIEHMIKNWNSYYKKVIDQESPDKLASNKMVRLIEKHL